MIALSRGLRNGTVLMFGLGVVAAACGGGGGTPNKNYRDAAASPDVVPLGSGGAAGTSGGAGAGAGLIAGGGGTPADDGGVPVTDGGFPIVDAAPPAPTNTLLVAGEGLLVGPGLSCSRPATGAAGAALPDRWCGLLRPSESTVSLHVFNLTKALAGTPITCAAGDPNCLLLDADLAIDDNATHGFNGQTLIYYDAAGVYAWRPGWTAGRLLLAAERTLNPHCEGSPGDVTTAICTEDDATKMGYNVYAGRIATQAGAVLPAVEPLGDGESNQIGFSPDSLSVIYSTSAAKSVSATLKMQTIGDNASRKIIATPITDWTLSPDGARWYWLSAPAKDANDFVVGTLQSAPYPAGTPPVDLQGNAFSYTLAGAKGLVTFSTPTPSGGDMKAIADVDNPTTTATVLQAKTARGVLSVHANGAILYFDDVTQPDPSRAIFLVNLRAVKMDGTGKCTVAADDSADVSASITLGGTGVTWIEVLFDTTGSLSAINGNVTTLADCAPHLFSPTMYSYTDVTAGLVLQENLDSAVPSVDLSYRAFTAAGAPSGTTMKIQQAADLRIEALPPDLARVLFSLNGRSSGNGIYASPVLTGAPTGAPVTLARTLGNRIGNMIGSASPLAALRRPSLLPLAAVSGLSSRSSSPATRLSPFERRSAAATNVRSFARFAVPSRLRRPSAP